MTSKKLLIFVGLFCTCLSMANAQKMLQTEAVEHRGNHYFHHKAQVEPEAYYLIEEDFAFTSLVIEFVGQIVEPSAYVELEENRFFLSQDEHIEVSEGMYKSNLIIFPGAAQGFHLFTGKMSGKIQIYYLNANFSNKNTIKGGPLQLKINENCNEPNIILQSEWRAGLPDPDYERAFTEVRHVIVHHSAGSNAETDYTQVVRNVYLHHTEVNGWSDIGYNYLIAQDGTIFAGRDPENGAQDDVRGAHFCGKNSHTMGVCLLGTYTDIQPSDATKAALIELLSWKLKKEDLDPLGAASHDANPNLGHITGHRDGCNTACPGDETYALLDEIRAMTLSAINACSGIVDEEDDPSEDDEVVDNENDTLESDPESVELLIYPNPNADGELYVQFDTALHHIQEVNIYDIHGKFQRLQNIDFKKYKNTIVVPIGHLNSGVYVVSLVGYGLYRRRLVVL